MRAADMDTGKLPTHQDLHQYRDVLTADLQTTFQRELEEEQEERCDQNEGKREEKNGMPDEAPMIYTTPVPGIPGFKTNFKRELEEEKSDHRGA